MCNWTFDSKSYSYWYAKHDMQQLPCLTTTPKLLYIQLEKLTGTCIWMWPNSSDPRLPSVNSKWPCLVSFQKCWIIQTWCQNFKRSLKLVAHTFIGTLFMYNFTRNKLLYIGAQLRRKSLLLQCAHPSGATKFWFQNWHWHEKRSL